MTEEQKYILIEKMLDAPASLTDEELDMIANDDELKDIYEISSDVSSACVGAPAVVVDDEWKRFSPRIARKPSLVRRFMRVAAVLLCVMLVSGIVVRLADRLLTEGSPDMLGNALIEQAGKVQEQDSTINSVVTPPPVVKVAGAKPRIAYRSKARRAAMTEIDLPDDAEIEEYLRIQKARIDNDIAMQTAEVITEEYAAMRQSGDFAGEPDAVVEAVINKITMQ